MPLVAHSSLPSFERLKHQGELIIEPARARDQYIRALHIGLLNMMPDAALQATERQFLRLIGRCNQVVQLYVYPFSVAAIERDAQARAYIDQYYQDFAAIHAQGLDALIITGLNPARADLADEPAWQQLQQIIQWAWDNATSTLCSCLATHAALQMLHSQRRQRLPSKCWGVFEHKLQQRQHPLVRNINTCFNVPHSRHNAIHPEQFQQAGLQILASSAQGVHLATSGDGIRQVFFQGHPEYATNSLLKEYKREVANYIQQRRPDYPPTPANYFDTQTQAILAEYQQALISGTKSLEHFPEALIEVKLDNTWSDTGGAIMNNWLGLVYQLTNKDRKLPFMEGIDPNQPLATLNPGTTGIEPTV